MPGEGNGQVIEILTDLIENKYKGFISIEPHIASVFHEEDNNEGDQNIKDKEQFDTYVKYGKKLEEMIETITN